ncbi:MAG: hypothetical protein Ct9H300mP32_4570 [Verrucomicrobiota bacterium]|nr:MAG: hypothetical protein Ct9H300mP32_4570 [Verrucomicrobiota bacterium]
MVLAPSTTRRSFVRSRRPQRKDPGGVYRFRFAVGQLPQLRRTDNYLGGRMGGAHLGKLLGGKGSVLLLRYAVGSASTTKRENGFLDELKENFPGIRVFRPTNTPGPPATWPTPPRKTC